MSAKLAAALRQFVDTINATGGLIVNDAGETAPAADEDWIDLAEAYLAACDALGVEPWNVESEEIERQNREDLCSICKTKDHDTCGADDNCACCRDTQGRLAEEDK